MTTATEVVLQSGTPVTALRLAPGISVRRTEGPVGVFVDGVDLADTLTGDQIRSLVAIWNNAGVMILRGQDRLTAERQAQIVEWFGRRFSRGVGPDAIDQLPMVGSLPVQLLSNRDRRRPGREVITGAKMAAATQELKMHSDVQDYATPPDLTTLHAIDVPPAEAGGQTYFWDLIAAYDALDAAQQATVATLRWRPTSTYKTMKGVRQPQALANDTPDQASVVTHPVVRTPETLRQQLLAHIGQDRFRYTHFWEPHDVLFWDNHSVNHARDSWDGRYLREMHRAQAGGSVPF